MHSRSLRLTQRTGRRCIDREHFFLAVDSARWDEKKKTEHAYAFEKAVQKVRAAINDFSNLN